jgi:ribosome biogenesis protein Nip4
LVKIFADETIEDFSPERIKQISTSIGAMINENHKEFIIIMDKSQGTKYETYKSGVIKTLSDHFQKNVKPAYKNTGTGGGFIMQVVATNIVEGLLIISKNHKNKSWCLENVELLFLYHTRGIVQFY